MQIKGYTLGVQFSNNVFPLIFFFLELFFYPLNSFRNNNSISGVKFIICIYNILDVRKQSVWNVDAIKFILILYCNSKGSSLIPVFVPRSIWSIGIIRFSFVKDTILHYYKRNWISVVYSTWSTNRSIYNKGITSFWKETGAASVMIARAAEWNASVFRWSTHKLRIHAKKQITWFWDWGK